MMFMFKACIHGVIHGYGRGLNGRNENLIHKVGLLPIEEIDDWL